MPDTDFGAAASAGACVAASDHIEVAGGLRGDVAAGCGVPAARLGGGVAVSAAAACASGVEPAELLSAITVVSLAGSCAWASASTALLGRGLRLAGWSHGSCAVAGGLWVGPCGRAGGVCVVYSTRLRCERPLEGAAACVAAASGSLAWAVSLAGAAAGVSAVAVLRLDVRVALQGLCGSAGWERPQLSGASAGASAAAAVGLAICGVPNVALSG